MLAYAPESSSGSRRSLRILIADDNKDDVLTLGALLWDEGHEVRGVYRGDAVSDVVAAFAPDAVLLDIGMPGMTGYDVVRKLRADLRSECPLLIAITGWDKSADRILGRIAGFDHYLTKPCAVNAVLELLAPLVSPKNSA